MATTYFENIQKKIIAYLGNNWASTSIQYPNTDLLDVSNLNYFLTLDIMMFPSRRLCMTGNNDTGLIHTGEVVLNLYRKSGLGVGSLYQYVDDLADLFRYYAITWDSYKIQFYVPTVTELGIANVDIEIGREASKWWQVNISIPFEYLT